MNTQPSSSPTRDQILDSAFSLIQQKGANGISFANISAEVGIQKASIHHHFPTKADLLANVVERFRQQFGETLAGILGSRVKAKQKFRRYMGLFERTLQSSPEGSACLCGMLGAEWNSLDDSTRALVAGFYEDNLDAIETILKQGATEGSMDPAGDTRTLAKLVFSFLEGAIFIVRAGSNLTDFQAVTRRMEKLVAA